MVIATCFITVYAVYVAGSFFARPWFEVQQSSTDEHIAPGVTLYSRDLDAFVGRLVGALGPQLALEERLQAGGYVFMIELGPWLKL